MINVPAGARILLATRPIDFRKGAHGLAALAREVLFFSPLIAASATFALKSGEWFRRVRFVMSSPDWRRSSPRSGRNSTYRTVRVCRATSEFTGQHRVGGRIER
jgi:hypothetical protein